MWFYYIFQFLGLVLVPLAKLLMKALGIGAVSYIGINLVLEQVKSYVISNIGAAGPLVTGFLGAAKIDVFINIILAAVTTRMAIAGLNKLSNGKVKKYTLQA